MSKERARVDDALKILAETINGNEAGGAKQSPDQKTTELDSVVDRALPLQDDVQVSGTLPFNSADPMDIDLQTTNDLLEFPPLDNSSTRDDTNGASSLIGTTITFD